MFSTSWRKFGLVSVVLFLLLLPSVWAEPVVPFDPSLPAGTVCSVEIAKVHPTQFAVGKWEVDVRGEKIAKLKPKKLESYLKDHQAAIVIGPEGVPYLIDGHHLCSALLKWKVRPTVEAKVEANLRDLSPDAFWKTMKEKGWVYLYDEKGLGPLTPDRLPQKIVDLADDPYRSLAWAVCKRDGWTKSTTPFAEFRWAGYFRTRVQITNTPEGWEKAITEALPLCHHPDAKELPGYIPSDKAQPVEKKPQEKAPSPPVQQAT